MVLVSPKVIPLYLIRPFEPLSGCQNNSFAPKKFGSIKLPGFRPILHRRIRFLGDLDFVLLAIFDLPRYVLMGLCSGSIVVSV